MSRRAGVTLTELMIAGALLSVVFLAASSVYVTGRKMLAAQQIGFDELRPALAMEHMVRRIGLGNNVIVDAGDKQIRVQWDYIDFNAPLGTPQNFADDTWVKYRFIGGALHWRVGDAALTPVVTIADPVVDPDLVVDGASFFSLDTDPPNPALPPTVRINLVTGTLPDLNEIRTSVILRSMTQ